MKKPVSLDFIITFIAGFLILLDWDIVQIGYYLIFFGLSLIYLWLDHKINETQGSRKQEKYWDYKTLLFFTVVVFLTGVYTVHLIVHRIDQPEIWQVHDSQMQVESAVEFLLAGKNPYAENYFKTQMGKLAPIIETSQGFDIPNPALKHAIMLPFHFLISIPFYLFFKEAFGFFDERIVYIIMFFVTLITLFSLPKKKEDKFSLVALFTFTPLFFVHYSFGRDDLVVWVWLGLILWCLKKEKILLSSLFLAFACTSKHSAWFIIPFYYLYLLLKETSVKNFKSLFLAIKRKGLTILKQTWLFSVVFLLIILPFFLWNPKAFYEDIFAFPAGTLSSSYPINGFGLSVALFKLGFADKVTAYLPIWMIQIPACLLTLAFLIHKQLKDNSLSRVMYGYGLLILVFWLTSRFFHDNYVVFVSQLFLLAYFI